MDKTNGDSDRVKELIKYKGFQVAPAELEGKLMDHPDINDVAVIGVQDEEMHTEVPRAYIVPAKGKNSGKDAKAIVEWIAGQVANHKRLRGGVRFIDEGMLCTRDQMCLSLTRLQCRRAPQARFYDEC
jgi:4-coumarate--CoA ligase